MVLILVFLQIKRRASEMFQGKHGFITLRDLFRWAMRYSKFKPDTQFYDWDQHVAEEGYLVLSSRIRKPDELGTILESLEKVFKKKINTEELFSRDKSLALKQEMEYISKMTSVKTNMVWTSNALRMTALLLHSFRFVSFSRICEVSKY